MAQLTMVDNDLVHEWVAEAAELIAGDVVPLSAVCDSLNSEDPQYFWKQTVFGQYTQRWVIAYKDSGEPVLVGSAGRVTGCASRPHGNHIPSKQSIPGEYKAFKIYGGDINEVYKAKQFWWIMNNDPHRPHLGSYMTNLETALQPLLANTFKGNQSIKGLRSDWNIPQSRGVYKLEHPLLCSRTEHKDRLATLVDDDQLPAHEWISTLEKNCNKGYVITPGRPQVLSKRGAHSDPEVNPVTAETDEDFHQPDDIVWFSGEIHAKANPESYKESRVCWSTAWRLESVIRIARAVPSSPQTTATEGTSDGVPAREVPVTPSKRRRLNPEEFPSPTKRSYAHDLDNDEFLRALGSG